MSRRSLRPSLSAAAAVAAVALPKRVAPDRCDCLIHCGDDPWLTDGRAQPCAAKVARDREAAEIQRRFALQRQIADGAAVRSVEFGAPSVWIAGLQWFDTAVPSTAQPAAEVARAAEYLVLRRMAEQHPHKPHLVRILHAAQRPTLETTTP